MGKKKSVEQFMSQSPLVAMQQEEELRQRAIQDEQARGPYRPVGMEDLAAQAAPSSGWNPERLSKDDLWRYKKMEEALGQDQRMMGMLNRPSTGGDESGFGFWGAYAPSGNIYNAFTGDLAYLRDAGIAQKSTGGGDIDRLTQELTDLAGHGAQFGNTAMKNAGQISRMAPDLARYGVRSLSDLQAVNVPGYGTLYYNKANNSIVPLDFGSSMHGEGGTYFSLGNVNGRVVPVTKWTDTSDKQAIMGGLSVLGAAAGLGGLGSVLGGAMGTSAATGNAAVGAGMGALQGGVSGGWEGALKGALTGGIGGGVSALNPAGMAGITNPTLQAGVNSAISGGLKSAIQGRDPFSGALTGGVSGMAGEQFGPLGSMAAGALGSYLMNSGPQPSQLAAPPGVAMGSPGPAALARRQFHISGLGQPQQSRIRGAFDTMKGYGYTGLNDVDFT